MILVQQILQGMYVNNLFEILPSLTRTKRRLDFPLNIIRWLILTDRRFEHNATFIENPGVFHYASDRRRHAEIYCYVLCCLMPRGLLIFSTYVGCVRHGSQDSYIIFLLNVRKENVLRVN